MRRRGLTLVPFGPPHPDPALLDWLVRELAGRIRVRARVAPPLPLPAGPVDADALLDRVVDLDPPIGDRAPADWLLGVTAAPLHAHRRPAVLGEAAVGGAWAIVTTAPLVVPSRPGGTLDPDRLQRRLLKEALHEIGHVAGLDHCATGRCVMTRSADAADVDAKGVDFCPECAASLAALDPPLVDR